MEQKQKLSSIGRYAHTCTLRHQELSNIVHPGNVCVACIPLSLSHSSTDRSVSSMVWVFGRIPSSFRTNGGEGMRSVEKRGLSSFLSAFCVCLCACVHMYLFLATYRLHSEMKTSNLAQAAQSESDRWVLLCVCVLVRCCVCTEVLY